MNCSFFYLNLINFYLPFGVFGFYFLFYGFSFSEKINTRFY
ncbi:hypothetical protein SeV_A1378 [Salmonella enterica subsp. enterica serovar Virchow str. SL491]|uniref:Uncharacterized protein n=1 Tax=Salmonella virchow (strain SL491) TaxID=465517 RepID=A0A6C8EQW0_SALV4|nr:hypothetical protein SeV_A1378 [Salmonella enterica subsp. enterica serovar Virchow str. SL491]